MSKKLFTYDIWYNESYKGKKLARKWNEKDGNYEIVKDMTGDTSSISDEDFIKEIEKYRKNNGKTLDGKYGKFNKNNILFKIKKIERIEVLGQKNNTKVTRAEITEKLNELKTVKERKCEKNIKEEIKTIKNIKGKNIIFHSNKEEYNKIEKKKIRKKIHVYYKILDSDEFELKKEIHGIMINLNEQLYESMGNILKKCQKLNRNYIKNLKKDMIDLFEDKGEITEIKNKIECIKCKLEKTKYKEEIIKFLNFHTGLSNPTKEKKFSDNKKLMCEKINWYITDGIEITDEDIISFLVEELKTFKLVKREYVKTMKLNPKKLNPKKDTDETNLTRTYITHDRHVKYKTNKKEEVEKVKKDGETKEERKNEGIKKLLKLGTSRNEKEIKPDEDFEVEINKIIKKKTIELNKKEKEKEKLDKRILWVDDDINEKIKAIKNEKIEVKEDKELTDECIESMSKNKVKKDINKELKRIISIQNKNAIDYIMEKYPNPNNDDKKKMLKKNREDLIKKSHEYLDGKEGFEYVNWINEKEKNKLLDILKNEKKYEKELQKKAIIVDKRPYVMNDLEVEFDKVYKKFQLKKLSRKLKKSIDSKEEKTETEKTETEKTETENTETENTVLYKIYKEHYDGVIECKVFSSEEKIIYRTIYRHIHDRIGKMVNQRKFINLDPDTKQGQRVKEKCYIKLQQHILEHLLYLGKVSYMEDKKIDINTIEFQKLHAEEELDHEILALFTYLNYELNNINSDKDERGDFIAGKDTKIKLDEEEVNNSKMFDILKLLNFTDTQGEENIKSFFGNVAEVRGNIIHNRLEKHEKYKEETKSKPKIKCKIEKTIKELEIKDKDICKTLNIIGIFTGKKGIIDLINELKYESDNIQKYFPSFSRLVPRIKKELLLSEELTKEEKEEAINGIIYFHKTKYLKETMCEKTGFYIKLKSYKEKALKSKYGKDIDYNIEDEYKKAQKNASKGNKKAIKKFQNDIIDNYINYLEHKVVKVENDENGKIDIKYIKIDKYKESLFDFSDLENLKGCKDDKEEDFVINKVEFPPIKISNLFEEVVILSCFLVNPTVVNKIRNRLFATDVWLNSFNNDKKSDKYSDLVNVLDQIISVRAEIHRRDMDTKEIGKLTEDKLPKNIKAYNEFVNELENDFNGKFKDVYWQGDIKDKKYIYRKNVLTSISSKNFKELYDVFLKEELKNLEYDEIKKIKSNTEKENGKYEKEIVKKLDKVDTALRIFNEQLKGHTKEYKENIKNKINKNGKIFTNVLNRSENEKVKDYEYGEFKKDYDEIREYKRIKGVVEFEGITKINNYLSDITWKMLINASRLERDIGAKLNSGLLQKGLKSIDKNIERDKVNIFFNIYEFEIGAVRNKIAHLDILKCEFDVSVLDRVKELEDAMKYRTKYNNAIKNSVFETFKRDVNLNYDVLRKRHDGVIKENEIIKGESDNWGYIENKKVSVLALKGDEENVKRIKKLLTHKF